MLFKIYTNSKTSLIKPPVFKYHRNHMWSGIKERFIIPPNNNNPTTDKMQTLPPVSEVSPQVPPQVPPEVLAPREIQNVPPNIIPRFDDVDYPPVKELTPSLSDGNTTLNECVLRPLAVIENHFENLPASKLMYDSIVTSASFLRLFIPETKENIAAAASFTEETKATLEKVRALEKNLNENPWGWKTAGWAAIIISTLGIIGHMIYTRQIPSLGNSIFSEMISGAFNATKGAAQKTGQKTAEKVASEGLSFDNTYNILLDHPGACIAIVAVTAATIVGFRGSFRVASFIYSKLKK